MLVTRSRDLYDGSENRLFFDEIDGPSNRQRLRLLTWRRMHELGLRTYKEFAQVSGISELVIRGVLAPRGNKNVGPDLAERWLIALQLDVEDYAEVGSWINNESVRLAHPLEGPDHAAELFPSAVLVHEKAEFDLECLSARRLYLEAADNFSRIAAAITNDTSREFKLIKARALLRLAQIENIQNREDRAIRHAEEAASLARGADGDTYLLARRESALAYLQLGRSGWREGLRILDQVRQPPRWLGSTLGGWFPDQDVGLWVRLTQRDAASVLLRRRDRTEARDALAEFRIAMRRYGEPQDEFLIKVVEARLQTKEGRGVAAMRTLLDLYNSDVPESVGPRHYQTLLSAMAEAQVMSEWRDPDGRDYLREALQWARSNGLVHQENELWLRFREPLSVYELASAGKKAAR